jgi:2-dehydropantoate 2-reductase
MQEFAAAAHDPEMNDNRRRRRTMRILVCGAGVIGTLYGARLQEAGHQVTVLARASRLVDLERHGLVIENVVNGHRTATPVGLSERLGPDDRYDIALVAVRRDQLSGILPDLEANRNIPVLLFMLNNPFGSAHLGDACSPDRVVLGFPGAGGTLEDHVVRYAMIPQQPTTLGDPRGMQTVRPRMLADALRTAGFRTRIDRNMDAWLLCHAFFVTAVSGAIYLAGGDCTRLSESPATLDLMIRGVREGFRAVETLGQPIHPFPLRVLFTVLPTPLVLRYWRRFFADRMAEYVFARHARHASVEMQALAIDCRQLLGRSGVDAPALDRLYRAVDAYNGRHTR